VRISLTDPAALADYLIHGLRAASDDEIEVRIMEGKAIIALPKLNKAEIIQRVAGKIPLSDPFMQEVLHARRNEVDRDV
jgi:hypothetical protein